MNREKKFRLFEKEEKNLTKISFWSINGVMSRYIVLLSVLLLVTMWGPGCKSTSDKRLNKDIIGINEQLYDLEKNQIKDANRLKKLEATVERWQTDHQAVAQEQTGESDLNKIYQEAYRNYLDQKFEDAIKQFSQITGRFKEDSLVDNALYWQAESYYKLNKTEQALSYYQLIYRYFPFSSKADYALYKIGMIYMEMKDYSRAALAFNRLISEYGSSDLYQSARVKLNQIKTNQKNRR